MDQVAQEVNQLLGGDGSCLLLDESGFEKKGEHSLDTLFKVNPISLIFDYPADVGIA